MRDRAIKMARRTWQAVGADFLQLLDGDAYQEDVIECVGDADRMLTHGGDKEAYEWWKSLSYKEQEEILEEAFPAAQYGM